jgi:hypothetical protein
MSAWREAPVDRAEGRRGSLGSVVQRNGVNDNPLYQPSGKGSDNPLYQPPDPTAPVRAPFADPIRERFTQRYETGDKTGAVRILKDAYDLDTSRTR